MNEEAIKALEAMARHAADDYTESPAAMLRAVIAGGIRDLKNEALVHEARLKTLCQSDGMVLTVHPPLYRCYWCYGTWCCSQEPPVCTKHPPGANPPTDMQDITYL